MRRFRRVILWSLLAFILVVTALMALVLRTPFSERVAERVLSRTLARSGGAFTVASRKGSLAGGLDLEGVRLDVPPNLKFTARHIHLRLSRTALLAGTLLLKDLRIVEPRVELLLPKNGRPQESSAPIPSWLRVSAPSVVISEGTVVLNRENGAENSSMIWSGVDAKSDCSWFMGHLSVHLETITLTPPAPSPSPLHASGTLDIALSGDLRFDLAVASPQSRVKARGAWKGRQKVPRYHASIQLAPLALREVGSTWKGAPDLQLNGSVQVEGDLRSIDYQADLQAAGLGPVSSKGKVGFLPDGLDLAGDCRTTGADLAPFWAVPKGRETKVSGEGTWGVQVRRGALERWEAKARLARSTVWGLPVDSATLAGSGSGERLEASGHWNAPLSGPCRGSVQVDLGRAGWRTEASGPQVQVFDLLQALGVDVPLPDPIRPPEGPWGMEHFAAWGVGATFSVESKGADAEGGRWDFALGPMSTHFPGFTLRFERVDPSVWGLLPGKPGMLGGEARYTAEGASSGTLDLALNESRWAGIAVHPLRARVRFSPEAVVLDPVALDTRAGTARLAGTFYRDGRVEGPLDLEVGNLTSLRPFLGEGLPSGALKASVQITGRLGALAAEGQATLSAAALGGFALDRGEIHGRWNPLGPGSDLSLAWTGASHQGQLLGAGKLTLRGKPAALQGALEMEAGADRRVALQARGGWGPGGLDLEVEGVKLEALGRTFTQEGPARLTWNSKAVAWSGFTLVKKESRLSTSGQLGLEGPFGSAPLTGTLTARRFPLALFPIPSTAGTVAGFLDADLTWSGQVSAPVLHGGGTLAEGLYRYANSDQVITPITASFRAEGDRLVVEEARATTPKGGEATGSGFVRFKGFWPEEYRFIAEGHSIPFVIGRDMDGVADFKATLSGTLARPVLEGSATLTKGRIQLPELERRKPLPDTVRFINAPPGSPYAPTAEAEASLIGPLRGRVQLRSDGGLWISSRNLLAELSGALTARFTEQGPTLEGSLEVLQGRFLFQGKKFELQESRVSFDGGTDLTPYLNVKALYQTRDTDVEVHLTGRASKPELSLTSRPPMDQADILSVLVLGHRANEMGTGDSAQYSAAAGAVTLYGSSPLVESAKEALGLDSVVVGVGANSQLGFSKYLGDKAILEYQQTFGALPEWWVNLRYRIDKNWSVQTGSNSKGTTGIDLFWERRY